MSAQICSYSPAHSFSELIHVLRQANHRYRLVAISFRTSLKPTRHARKRATGLGLSIDIARAVACPQSQVSVVPLPVVEQVFTEDKVAIVEDKYTVLPPRLSKRAKIQIKQASNPRLPVVHRHSETHELSVPRSVESEVSGVTTPSGAFEEISLDDGDMDFKCIGLSSASSSSASSSTGPATPEDASPLFISIKRKSPEFFDDTDAAFEKRRKTSAKNAPVISHSRARSLAAWN